MSPTDLARLAAAAALFAWLPGYVWGRALLPKLTRLERAVASVGLSVAMMTLALYTVSLTRIAVDAATAVWVALAITLTAGVPPLARWATALVTQRPRPPGASPTRSPPIPGGDATGAPPPPEGRGR